MPLDHVSVPVPHAKLEEEIKFITTAFAPLGIKEHFRPAPGVVGLGDAVPFLWVVGIDENHKPIEEEEGKPGRSCHLALKAAGKSGGICQPAARALYSLHSEPAADCPPPNRPRSSGCVPQSRAGSGRKVQRQTGN